MKLGEIGGAPFYMSASQFEYWKHTKLIIDVVPGRGGMFSLENPEGVRFLTRSRVFTQDEADNRGGRAAGVDTARRAPPQRRRTSFPRYPHAES